jgi:hypothetical protein
LWFASQDWAERHLLFLVGVSRPALHELISMRVFLFGSGKLIYVMDISGLDLWWEDVIFGGRSLVMDFSHFLDLHRPYSFYVGAFLFCHFSSIGIF